MATGHQRGTDRDLDLVVPGDREGRAFRGHRRRPPAHRLTGDPDLRRSLVARAEDGAWYPLRASSRSRSSNGPPTDAPPERRRKDALPDGPIERADLRLDRVNAPCG